MTATLDFIQQRFDEFNRQMFGGSLPPLPIELSNARTFLGQCVFKRRRGWFGRQKLYDFRLRVSKKFDLPENELEDIIIHEMIHYYIGVNGLKDSSSHGKIFREMMQHINNTYGRNITISRRLTAEEREHVADKRRKKRVVALVTFADGRKGVKVLPNKEDSILRYRQVVGGSKEVSGIRVFISDDPYYNRFPCSSAYNVCIVKDNPPIPDG